MSVLGGRLVLHGNEGRCRSWRRERGLVLDDGDNHLFEVVGANVALAFAAAAGGRVETLYPWAEDLERC